MVRWEGGERSRHTFTAAEAWPDGFRSEVRFVVTEGEGEKEYEDIVMAVGYWVEDVRSWVWRGKM